MGVQNCWYISNIIQIISGRIENNSEENVAHKLLTEPCVQCYSLLHTAYFYALGA